MNSDIASSVRSLYKSRFDELELDYQLHFASRLFSWEGDPWANNKLELIKQEIVGSSGESRREKLIQVVEDLKTKDMKRDVNDIERRQKYFDKYPDLLKLHSLLFRIRHWLCIYGVDERELLFSFFSKSELEGLLNELKSDSNAIRYLSTYIINTVYLYSHMYRDKKLPIDLSMVMSLKSNYDFSNPKDVQIYIYLLTHCIIGETLFYYEPIDQYIEDYQEMINDLTELISNNFDDINLDSKCEFLVCSKLVGVDTELRNRIEEEVSNSVNEEGFVVDKHNNNINPLKQSFLMSEHRNVLYVMSQSEPKFVQP